MLILAIRCDYLLISHFLLNLQELSTFAAEPDIARPSFVRSEVGQLTSVRFADMVVGNLGESLGGWSTENGDDDGDGDEGTLGDGGHGAILVHRQDPHLA